MSAQYTPGPWKIRGDISLAIENADGSAIALPCSDHGISAVPNARLIAAAPELVEVLREARKALADMVEHWGYSTHYTEEAREDSLDRAENIAAGVIPAALKKAGVSV